MVLARAGLGLTANILHFIICICFALHNAHYGDTAVVEYQGLLSPRCIVHYFRVFVSPWRPHRNYQYYHEVLAGKDQKVQVVVPTWDTPINWRIVGGKAIDITEAPYQVMFGKYCGGSLIAPEWVITAAHCKNTEKYVYAGNTLRSLATRYRVCAHFMHPYWNSSFSDHKQDYDYQLLLLETPVPVTPSSRPIAIASLQDLVPGAMIAVTGWGHSQYKKSRMQDHLRHVNVPVMSEKECTSLPVENYKKITPRMFCAGFINGTKDSCQGDSGGPAVYNGKLVGLVSFGVGCAMKNRPGVYSNIPVVRDWIQAITGLPI